MKHVADIPLGSSTLPISSGMISQTSALAPVFASYLTGVYQQCMTSGANRYLYREFPPSKIDLIAKIGALQAKIYQPPFYSNEADVSERSREFAGLVYHPKGGKGTAFLEEFMPVSESARSFYSYPRFEVHSGWEFASFPPSRKEIRRWLKYEMVYRKKLSSRKTPRSQVRFHLLTSRSISNRSSRIRLRDRPSSDTLRLRVRSRCPESSRT